MDPWTILGWLCVTLVLAPCVFIMLALVVRLANIVLERAAAYRRYLRSRKIQPAAGQIWRQGNNHLTITRITDTGRICVQISYGGTRSSWSDSPEEWANRVRNRRLTLVRDA